MEILKLDMGIREYKLPGGGVLRFNPSDPNVYSRFYQAEEKLSKIQMGLEETATGIEHLAAVDKELKSLFNWLLGGDNDVDKALGGVSLLAVCKDGKTVAAKLLSALETILEEGARKLVDSKAETL